MSTSSLLGIVFLIAAILLLAYQGMTAFMGMGTSNDFVFENIRLADFMDVEVDEGGEGLSSVSLQSLKETLLTMPLAILLFAAAIFFFLVHAFTSERQIRKH